MKQTNSAIKFLIAQYRAIFKSAYVKGFVSALTITAAIAIPQAQAAPPAEINAWDTGLTSGDAIEVNGTDKILNISGAKVENTTGFTLNITGGDKNIIKGEGAKGEFTVQDKKHGIINVNGEGAVLTIGGAQNSGASVTVETFTNNLGKVSISAKEAASASALVANTITIGTEKPAQAGSPTAVAAAKPDSNAIAEPTATITLGNFATLGDNKAALTVKDTGGLVFAADATAENSKAISKDGIQLQGGLIKVEDNGNGTIEGGLKVSSGNVVIDGTKGGSLTVSGTTEFTGGALTIGAKGTFKTVGTDDFNVDLSKASIKNAGTIDLGSITDNHSGSLIISSEQYEKVFAGKVTATGAGNNSKLILSVTGSGDVALDTIVKANDGTLNADKLGIQSSGTVLVNAKDANVSYTGDTLSGGTYSFGSFSAGKAGSFTLDGTDLTVNKSLTLVKSTAKPDTKAADATANKAAIKLINNGSLTLAGHGSSLDADVLVGSSAKAPSMGTLKINAGDWTVNTLDIQSGSVAVNNATLAVKGDLTTTAKGKLSATNGTVDASKVGKSDLAASSVTLTGGKFIIDQADMFTISGDKIVYGNGESKFAADSVSGDSASVFQINNLSAGITKEQIKQIKKDLSNFSGFIELGGNSSITSETGKKPWADVSGDAVINGLYTGVTVQGDTFDKPASVGNLELDAATSATIGANSTVILNNAAANHTAGKQQFITNKSGETAGAALTGDNSKLVLMSTGEIGSITTANNSGSLSVGHVNGAGHVTVIGDIGATGTGALKNVTVLGGSSLALKGETGGVFAQQLVLEQGSELNAKGHNVTIGKDNTASKIYGDLTAQALNVNVSGTSVTIAGDASVSLDKLSLASGTITQIGDDTATNNGSASVFTKALTGEGTLFVDPDYNQKAAIFTAQSLADATSEQTAGSLKGKLIIGNNAAVGIGFKSEAEVLEVIRPYLDAAKGAFSESGTGFFDIGNALVLGKSITVANNQSINLKKGATSADTGTNDHVSLGAGTAIIVTDAAFTPDANGNKNGAAITLGTSGAVDGNGGKVILSGNFDAADNALKIFDNSAHNVTVTGDVEVRSANGRLKGTISSTNKGTVDLDVDEEELKKSFTTVSGPVSEALKNTLRGKFKAGSGEGKNFLYDIANNSATGYEADAAAHAATYAGAQQAAVSAVSTLATSVAARVGSAGVEASSIDATGSQANGGVWVSPMYKSVNADGFNAQGANYGADIDLAGVTFGADTVNGNMRFGAVFNIGSGDADGKGNGTGLKNDFDYYGLGMYTAMTFGNFALVGDASVNVISNDVEGLGLNAEADTTAVTMGVTGQYTIASPFVDVTPHLGARFLRFDTDSYDLRNEAGVIANTDFDVQNVFSIPLGVTLSKAIEMGGWSLAPSADLTITFNSGDTEAKSTTYFTGADTLSLNAEVLDEVTYGATLGLAAQYGAFGTALNVNYTGSQNTDSFGVNASARYMF